MTELSQKEPKISELNLFKNEILSHLREIEAKLNTKKMINHSKYTTEFEAQTVKMNNLINHSKKMILSLVSQK